MQQAGKDLPVIEDLAALFIQDIPLIDVRAPIEFQEGAFPCATNLPLMDDQDRAEIGKRYKQQGQDAAIALGLERVSGAVKTQRIQAWANFVKHYPHGALYCFRGGLRSRISQQWLYEHTGIAYPRVKGGYKTLRRFLLEQLQNAEQWLQPMVLTGRTGSGKTQLLQHFQQKIDLEQLANHRGSAFGPRTNPQPSQISFENALAIALLRQQARGTTTLLFEDESRMIGSVHIPDELFNTLRTAPLILLQSSDEERIALSYQEYVVDMMAAFEAKQAGDWQLAFTDFSAYILGSLEKVKRRLGGVRYQQVKRLMQVALAYQQTSQELTKHQAWVEYLLLNYYDPMYDYQIQHKQDRLVFSGSPADIAHYLQQKGIT